MSEGLVLITGATGFVGRTLCPYLVERGVRLRALVRPTSNHAFLESLGVERAWGDLRDPPALTQALSGCTAVVHAAAHFRLWGRRRDFFAVNVAGTRNLLAAAQQTGVERFVHISTIAVVGRPPRRATITEETPCRPWDAYQESKLEAERLVLSSGLPVIVLRPGAIYGPGSHYAANRLFFEDPLQGRPLQVHRGRHITFPTFVRDVAQAVHLSLSRGRIGQVYNICGECLTQRQVGETVARVLGRPARFIPVPGWGMVVLAWAWSALAHVTGREPYYPLGLYPYIFYDWPVSIEKAQRELGFAPTPFEEGARETLAWYSLKPETEPET